MRRINVGCGPRPMGGWENWDAYCQGGGIAPRSADELADLPADSIDAIRAEHVIEHLRRATVPNVLRAAHHALVPGGFLWVSMPDLGVVMRRWLATDGEAGDGAIWGKQDRQGQYHYGGFTAGSLLRALESAGFADVEVLQLPRGRRGGPELQGKGFK